MEEFKMDQQPNKSVVTRKRLFGFLMILFVLVLGITIGTLISHRVDATGPGDSQLQMQTDGKPVAEGAFLALSQAFEEVATRVEPSVVNINTEEVITNRRQRMPGQIPDDPMNDLFRRFFDGPFGQMPEQQLRRSLGSGVIVDPKGYIITNNHVVEDATKIKVSLAAGEEFTAKVIGTDPVSDIAVIKIDGGKDFPYARIGNSKAMKVGDWVIAIGSPFGLEQTVTAGIISTTGRTFKDGGGPSGYSYLNDYLQTDAAINRGNSGGPLVNMNAEVVGINSFISTTSGASAGVGFAVPSHLFTKVYNQILQSGKVSRGWVGVSMNGLPFTPAMADFFGVKQGAGVLITQLVDENGEASETGPAAKAGVKPEDVVIEFDGQKILDTQDFRLAVANTLPGRKAKIKVVRHGQEKEFEIAVAERQFEDQGKSRYSFEETEEKPKAELGFTIDNVPSRIAQSLEISGGAYVLSVKPGSLADDAGLEGGEQGVGGSVIVSAGAKPISNAQDLLNVVKSLKSGDPLILKFLRIGRRQDNKLAAEICYTSIIKP
jgi:serine protease Do